MAYQAIIFFRGYYGKIITCTYMHPRYCNDG